MMMNLNSDDGPTSQPASDAYEGLPRKSSGLVRELSLFDTAAYGVLAAGALFGTLYIFPLPQSILPGLNIPLSVLIAMALMIPVFALYAGLGSAMPRAGGDYLYQTRAIHPAIGFSFTFAWEVFIWVTFTTTGGLVVSTLGLQPLFYNLGLKYGSAGLMNAASWIGSDTGLFVTILVLSFLAFLITLRGIGSGRDIQRYVILPAVVLSNIVLIILLILAHDSFIEDFNNWHEKALGIPNYSQSVIETAAGEGFVPPKFSLRNTFLFLSVTGVIWYVAFGAQGLLGETKQANNFKKLFNAFTMGGIYVGLVSWALPTWLFQRMVGSDFLSAYSHAFYGGGIEAPAGVTVTSFVMMTTDNPIVLILLSLGFIAVGFYFATSVFLNMTRVLSGMGVDRTLPKWFGKISKKTHAPINAAIFYLALATILNILYWFSPSIRNTMMLAGAFTGVGIVAITGLAGVLFPYRAKSIFDASPVAKYKLFNLPLITVVGAIVFLAGGGVTLMNLIYPELGFTTPEARGLIVFSLIASFIWYYLYRAYLKSFHGVNTDLVFKQSPPE